MPYNFAADSFHTTTLCSRLSSTEVDLYENQPFCVFEPLGCLEAAYDVHLLLMLIGKRVVDFLLVIIELFSPGFTADAP